MGSGLRNKNLNLLSAKKWKKEIYTDSVKLFYIVI